MNTICSWFPGFDKYAGTWPLLGLFLLCGGTTLAQQTAPDAGQASSETPAIRPITAAAVPVQAVAVSTLLRHASDELAADENVEAIKKRYAAATARLDVLHEQTLRRVRRGGPATILQDTEKQWLRVETRLDGWLQTLISRTDAIDSLMKSIDSENELWVRTRDDPDTDLPAELQKTVQETIGSIATVETRLLVSRNTLLSLQARIAQQKVEADGMLADLRQEISERRQALFSIDSSPLWHTFSTMEETGDLAKQLATTRRNAYSAVPGYLEEIRLILIWQFSIFALLLIFIIALNRKARIASEQDNSLRATADLLRRPVAAAVLIFLPFTIVIDPRAPALWNSIIGVVIIVAVARLMPQLVRRSKHHWTIPIVVLFLVWQTSRVTPIDSPIHRFMLLIMSVLGVLICVWSAREVISGAKQQRKTWLRAVALGSRVAAAALVAGVIANVVGSVGLATFVADGIMYAIFGVMLVSLAAKVFQALVHSSLLTQSARRFNIVRSRSDSIRAALFRSIRWIAVISWIYIVLTGFLIIDPVMAFIKKIIETNISVGELALSPEDIFLFVFVVWLSFKLSQFIRFVLESAVLPHMHLPRGAPAAITSLTHYAVIVIGVMFALSAAGFDMGRVTILFGALGVGVGFGLQNIVNNFLSGLILLFERPIKIGDVIEINESLAVVKHIAMRSSTVRTYDGAMVIVPNANLISAEVVNWTYGTDKQRVKIPVGVAYGTNPKTVLELLIEIAKSHAKVSETPVPDALFLGFGDSSLDFELRVWVPVSSRLKITSDLLVAITAALAEAGIEIPFPQQDLHLRSIADDASLKTASFEHNSSHDT